jgi:hypothetical protein
MARDHLVVRLEVSSSQLDRIEAMLDRLLTQEAASMSDLKDVQSKIQKLSDDVAAESTVTDSAVALLTGMNQTLKDVKKQLADAIASNDPAAIQAAADALDAVTSAVDLNSQRLADAVSANTPAEGE